MKFNEMNANEILALAENGDSQAQYIVGIMYEDGVELPQNYNKAVIWYRKSAELGNADAQCTLGFKLLEGIATSHDQQEEAQKWLLAAAQQGHGAARALVDATEFVKSL